MDAKDRANEQPGSPMAVDEDEGSHKMGESKLEEDEVPIFHKKFDKLRRHNKANNEGEKSRPSSPERKVPQAENIVTEAKKVEKPKKSTIEAHPQLFAHLNSPVTLPKPPYNPFMAQQPLPASNISSRDPMLVNTPRGMKSSVQKSPFVDTLISKHAGISKEQVEPGEKDVHQSTMLHLKDKLLRKYDSMENLNKIEPGSTEEENSENGQRNQTENKTNPVQFTQVARFPGPHMINPIGQTPQGLVYPQMFAGGLHMHPAFMGAAYNSMQAMNMLPAYNQHLAGMQQLAQLCVGQGQAQNITR